MSENALAAAAAAIIIICMIIGYMKGFIRFIFALTTTVLTLVIVMAVVDPVADYLQKSTPIYADIEAACSNKLTSGLPKDTTTLQQSSFIESLPVPHVLKEKIIENNNGTVYEALGVKDFTDYISAYTAKLLLKILAFILAFLLITVLLRMIFFALNGITRLPVLHGINKAAGLVAGAAMGVLAIWLFFLAVTWLYGTSFGQTCSAQIDESAFLSYLYRHNFLLQYLARIL